MSLEIQAFDHGRFVVPVKNLLDLLGELRIETFRDPNNAKFLEGYFTPQSGVNLDTTQDKDMYLSAYISQELRRKKRASVVVELNSGVYTLKIRANLTLKLTPLGDKTHIQIFGKDSKILEYESSREGWRDTISAIRENPASTSEDLTEEPTADSISTSLRDFGRRVRSFFLSKED